MITALLMVYKDCRAPWQLLLPVVTIPSPANPPNYHSKMAASGKFVLESVENYEAFLAKAGNYQTSIWEYFHIMLFC